MRYGRGTEAANAGGGDSVGGVRYLLQCVCPDPGDVEFLPIPQADPYCDVKLLAGSQCKSPEGGEDLGPSFENIGVGVSRCPDARSLLPVHHTGRLPIWNVYLGVDPLHWRGIGGLPP